MKYFWLLSCVGCMLLSSCHTKKEVVKTPTVPAAPVAPVSDFQWSTESFADKKIVRYQVPGFEKLSVNQKKLVYYLTQAGYAGRDIIYDQNYRHNLAIRRTLEKIITNYKGDKSSEDYMALELYAKQIWFSNGIHHHYSNDKFNPTFSKIFFVKEMKNAGVMLSEDAMKAMFDPSYDNKKVNLDPDKDLVKGSAVNFYDPKMTTAEVEEFYAGRIDKTDKKPISYGLNSKLSYGPDGKIMEQVWKVDGMYSASIKEVVKWLELATTVAENSKQKKGLQLLVEYYKTGDLRKWDEYSIAWAEATEGDIDYINGFIEVYQDPKGMRASYENIVQINDFDASARMAVVAKSAQYFEDNSPIMDQHKKKNVVGVSYKVVVAAGESGDASPATPIGVNLPNADWIRAQHGSKSVSLGNIIEAYANADAGGLLQEFANDAEEMARAEVHGQLSGKMHTALHEVIGHASGQIEPGVGSPAETVKSYASALEEARADLVGLYYIMDPKMVDLGLMPSLEVGKAQYDSYLRNGYMLQLRRIEPGKEIEEAHMRNRQLVAKWAMERALKEGSVVLEKRNGKTYIDIKDYNKLRGHFGDLLREVQRIKSQGDYAACKALFDNYAVKVDPVIHKEVLARSEKLNIPPYGGFINPKLVPVKNSQGVITDIKVEYPNNFMQQMLEYAKEYSTLPDYN